MFDEITPEELAAWLEAGAGVVDVREPWEFQSGHVPGAVNIPMGEVVSRKDELTDPLVLVCRSGARSGRVAEYLINNGHATVANLVGGTERWIAEGNDVE
ncbi:MAG TPA: rhodanese-like domain-containing protein [Trueperaceae bacterium]|nr:rhodanese-like domain-containing protein [Trueperaceae bacterium]